MLPAVVKAFKLPDLRQKIIFTVAMLVIFRIIAHIPVPGVDLAALDRLLNQSSVLGMLNLFSGGTMKYFSIATMGVYPYITASIIMQLMLPVIPRLQDMQKEGGEAGREKINRITHYLTIPLAFLQGFGQAQIMVSQGVIKNFSLFDPSVALRSWAMLISMVAGTMLLVWIGELITEFGIGNGISIIIFGGIVAGIPSSVGQLFGAGGTSSNIIGILVFLIIMVGTVIGIVLINEGQRRIPVQYAKRVRGAKMYQSKGTHIPLRVNSAGMIPLIFAVSILIFPSTVASYFRTSSVPWVQSVSQWIINVLQPTSPLYQLFYFLMVVGFTYFYTMVVFAQQNISENLQKSGGFIPGIRPGRPTAEYLQRVLNRITLAGALFLGVVAVLPSIAAGITGVPALLLSATALLIVVGVAIDTMRQLEAQLLMRQYEGFIH